MRRGVAEDSPMVKQQMLKMTVAMLACTLLTTLSVVDAQDGKERKAKTQGDINRERAKACEGLREDALRECLDNYVGPSRDATTSQEQADGSSSKSDQNKNGDDAAQGGEHDGSSPVDMSTAKKRAPIGPIRSGPENKHERN
jgi:hypothetical protein